METNTAIGVVTAHHAPGIPVGGPNGVRIDNRITMSLAPSVPIDFEESILRLTVLLRFVTAAVGRRQQVTRFAMEVGPEANSVYMDVDWSNHPRRRESGPTPSIYDLPLDAVHRPDEFVRVLKSWLQADGDRREARVRIDDSSSFVNTYPIDRLVAAANAFDILPDSAVPPY